MDLDKYLAKGNKTIQPNTLMTSALSGGLGEFGLRRNRAFEKSYLYSL